MLDRVVRINWQNGANKTNTTTSTLTWKNRWEHFWARWGVNRMGHRIAPGLYALGHPTPDSPVFVTANYAPSFDALRAHHPVERCPLRMPGMMHSRHGGRYDPETGPFQGWAESP